MKNKKNENLRLVGGPSAEKTLIPAIKNYLET